MDIIPYASIFIAFVLIYLPRQIVGAEMKKLGKYDNNDPRGQQAKLEGRGKRALAAHHNAFEAFAPFSIAVFCALSRSSNANAIYACCIAFVVFRIGYTFAYIEDRPPLRSGMWAMGLLSITGLFVLSLVGR
jgi:uncharacterized MAPEG superfamily protein